MFEEYRDLYGPKTVYSVVAYRDNQHHRLSDTIKDFDEAVAFIETLDDKTGVFLSPGFYAGV
jgi:hypothetical protein